MVMSAMVRIFSLGERLNVLFTEANENICAITRLKNIHYLFYIA